MTSSVIARCYCSLGPMISANLADTYLQAAGLVKCRGSVELVGLVRRQFQESVATVAPVRALQYLAVQ